MEHKARIKFGVKFGVKVTLTRANGQPIIGHVACFSDFPSTGVFKIRCYAKFGKFSGKQT